MPEFEEQFDSNAEADRYTPGGLSNAVITAGLLKLAFDTPNNQYFETATAETQANLNSTTGKVVNVTFIPSGVNLPWNVKYTFTMGAAEFVSTHGWTYTDATQGHYHSWKNSGGNSLIADYNTTETMGTGSLVIQSSMISTGHYSVTGQKLGELLPFVYSVTDTTWYGSTVARLNITPMRDMSLEEPVASGYWIVTKYLSDNTTGAGITVTSVATGASHGSNSWRIQVTNWGTDDSLAPLFGQDPDQRIVLKYVGDGTHGTLPRSPIKYIDQVRLQFKNQNRDGRVFTVGVCQSTSGTSPLASENSAGPVTGSPEWETISLPAFTPATGAGASNEFSLEIKLSAVTPKSSVDFFIDDIQIAFKYGALNTGNLLGGTNTHFNAGPRTTGVINAGVSQSKVYGVKISNNMSPSNPYAAGFITADKSLLTITGSQFNHSLITYPFGKTSMTTPYCISVPWATGAWIGDSSKVSWDIVRVGSYVPYDESITNRELTQSLAFTNTLYEWRGSGSIVSGPPFFSMIVTGMTNYDGFSAGDVTNQTASGSDPQSTPRLEATIIKTANSYHSLYRAGTEQAQKYVNSGAALDLGINNKTRNWYPAFGITQSGRVAFTRHELNGSDSQIQVREFTTEVPTSLATTTQVLDHADLRVHRSMGGIIASGTDATKYLLGLVPSGSGNPDFTAFTIAFFNGTTLVTGSYPPHLVEALYGTCDMIVSGDVAHIVVMASTDSRTTYTPRYYRISGSTLQRNENIDTGQFLSGAAGPPLYERIGPLKILLDNTNTPQVFYANGSQLRVYSPNASGDPWTNHTTVSSVTGRWVGAASTGTSVHVIVKGYYDNNNHYMGTTLGDQGPFAFITGTWGSPGSFVKVIDRAENYSFASGQTAQDYSTATDIRAYSPYNSAAKPFIIATGAGLFSYHIPFVTTHVSAYDTGTLTFAQLETIRQFKFITDHGSWKMTSGAKTFDAIQTTVAHTGSSFSPMKLLVSSGDIWSPPRLTTFLLEGKSRAEYLVTRNDRNFYKMIEGSGLNTGLFNFPEETDGNDDFTDSPTADADKNKLRTRIHIFS